MSSVEETIATPDQFVQRLIVTSTLAAVVVVLFALSVALYVMPSALFCGFSEKYCSYASVIDGPGETQGESQMNRLAVVFVSVWVMVITRTLFDLFLENHNFGKEPIGSALFGAMCAGVTICAIGCIRKLAYALAVIIALVVMTLYIEQHTTRGIVMVVGIIVGGALVFYTRGHIEAIICTIAICFLTSWSLVYCVLYWMSPITTRMDDATHDITSQIHDERTAIHLIIVSVLFVVLVTQSAVWWCVKKFQHRYATTAAANAGANAAIAGMGPENKENSFVTRIELERVLKSIRSADGSGGADEEASAAFPSLPDEHSDAKNQVADRALNADGGDSTSSDSDVERSGPRFDLSALTPMQRMQLQQQLEQQRGR